MPKLIDDSTKPQNLAINGAMDFFQRIEGNLITVNTASGTVNYGADMAVAASFGTTNKNYSFGRSTDVPTQAQSGFVSTYSVLYTQLTGIASPASTDQTTPYLYFMEGYDYQKIHAKPVTFGFWVKTSIPGTYTFSIRNNAGDRSYVTTFVTSTSGWEFKYINVTLDNAGAWAFDNNRGLTIGIGAVAGASLQTSSTGAWQSGNLITATGATNWMGTSGATFQVTQFQIYEGSLALSPTGFSRCGKDIQQELAMCQRYYEKTFDIGTAVGTATAAGSSMSVIANAFFFSQHQAFKVTKRAIPGITVYNTVNSTPGQYGEYTTGDVYSNTKSAISANVATHGFDPYANGGNASVGNFSHMHWIAEAGL